MTTSDQLESTHHPGTSRARASVRTVAALATGLALVLTACGGTAEDGGGTDDTTSEQSAPDVEGDDATADGTPGTDEMCAQGATDCDDAFGPDDRAGAGSAGSCPAGDDDCTDESYDGQDVARPLPLASEPLTGEEATVGATDGATATTLTGAHLLEDRLLQVSFDGDPCTVVEDVVVTSTPDEVRLLVLTGHEAGTDACIQSLVQYTTTVELDEPLGDRTVVDLGG